jgi:hypothetical protein
VARAGGHASDSDERRWTAAAFASQQALLAKLAQHGIPARPEYSYARVLNGFSAALDARAVALLERSPDVAGVYPVRVDYPATSRLAPGASGAVGVSPSSPVSLPGFDGRGVTIALLDTGIDLAQPMLRGRVQPGVDLVDHRATAAARRKPDDTTQVEQHGTAMAGILVGRGGDGASPGVATGATVFPIRVAGWQRDANGAWAVYSRTDQVLAGLDRAVDPNGDGDAHDGVRVALLSLGEPYAAFADGPFAKAVAGAAQLDTLVVTAAGNDGPAGPGFGNVSGPGGAPAALTVGAADVRETAGQVRVAVREGLDVEFDRAVALAGAVGPTEATELRLALPRLSGPSAGRPPVGRLLSDFFDRRGFSLAAGRAVLVPVGPSIDQAVTNAAEAGAAAVVLYGDAVPAGSVGLPHGPRVPVVSLPLAAGRSLVARVRAHLPIGISIGTPTALPWSGAGRVAPFSSRGLAFDGRVKPELVAQGVAVTTAAARSVAGAPPVVTVNGSSAAAATVAGAAALLLQARPGLGAVDAKGLLVGAARPLDRDPVTAQGAGLLDLGAAVSAEVTVQPTALAFTRATDGRWRASRTLVLRNVSSRPLQLDVRPEEADGPAAVLRFVAHPATLRLPVGKAEQVDVTARVVGVPHAPFAGGAIDVVPEGGQPVRVPWGISFSPAPASLLGAVAISAKSFKPSDTEPAVLSLQAGRVLPSAQGVEVAAVERLDVELWTRAGERLGVLARLRDLLPGRYALGLTGRGPRGSVLHPGAYQLRLIAVPTEGGPPSRKTVAFKIR